MFFKPHADKVVALPSLLLFHRELSTVVPATIIVNAFRLGTPRGNASIPNDGSGARLGNLVRQRVKRFRAAAPDNEAANLLHAKKAISTSRSVSEGVCVSGRLGPGQC